jgi:hypothetical protein
VSKSYNPFLKKPWAKRLGKMTKCKANYRHVSQARKVLSCVQRAWQPLSCKIPRREVRKRKRSKLLIPPTYSRNFTYSVSYKLVRQEIAPLFYRWKLRLREKFPQNHPSKCQTSIWTWSVSAQTCPFHSIKLPPSKKRYQNTEWSSQYSEVS